MAISTPQLAPDPALLEYLQSYFASGIVRLYLEDGEPQGTYENVIAQHLRSLNSGLWIVDDGFGICGIGTTPEEAIHNAQDWLEDLPMQKPTKGHRTYWADTNSTASLFMTTGGVVVFVGASSWRACIGRTTAEALEYLSRKQGSAVVRMVKRCHYFKPPEAE